MSVSEQQEHFCKTKFRVNYHDESVRSSDRIYRGQEHLRLGASERIYRESLEDLRGCKAVLDSVTRVLRRQSVEPGSIDCDPILQEAHRKKP